jgi:hypothetical protein
LGYTIPHPPLDDWRAAGRQVVAASLHYLFGAWRDSLTWHYEARPHTGVVSSFENPASHYNGPRRNFVSRWS